MYPVDVTSGVFKNAPFKPVGSRWESNAHSVLKVQLTAQDEETPLGEMGAERLRFYLNGQSQLTFKLYQMLFQNLIGLSVVVDG
ncbi:type VI secretion system baseplate subunit TssF, partial [Escherichia coli]|nr:type VI secretion system baseplate subunit TssF [Escherichia coli]